MPQEENPDNKKHALFRDDPPAKSAEYLRLALPLLKARQIDANPVNYALLYHYVAGNDLRLRELLDQQLQTGQPWSQETANTLFQRFLYGCDQEVLDALRDELLSVAAQTIGNMVDLAGLTSLSNKKIQHHIHQLAESQKASDVLHAVSAIISDTRNLIAETTVLERSLVGTSETIGKLVDELACAKKEATIDTLTGVMNRRGFEQQLDVNIRGDEAGGLIEFCMILLDLDHFKKINDSYGHLVGDKVLKAIGDLLMKHTKGLDSSCRYGGEEFAVLLPNTRITSAFNLAENLRLQMLKVRLKRPATGELIGGISGSFGVAAYRNGESKEAFVERCDKALYRAKKLGRNRVILAD